MILKVAIYLLFFLNRENNPIPGKSTNQLEKIIYFGSGFEAWQIRKTVNFKFLFRAQK